MKKAKNLRSNCCAAIAMPALPTLGNTCERCTFVNLQLDNYVKTHGVAFEITLIACSTGTNLGSPVRKT